MAINFKITEETLGYQTSSDPTNTDIRYLIEGSQNVLIDYNRKVGTRNGITRLGAGSSASTSIRNAFTWNTSTGDERPMRFYDDEWEVYLGTVDGIAINAWTRVASSMNTTATPRGAVFFDTTENIDELILVQGDDNLYEWGGAVAVVLSITGTTITKEGTTTFAQNRFYTSANKVVVCVRTGTEYTYTGGESTTTLTGISDTAGLIAGDILVQKIVTAENKPASNRNNHTIFSFENQIVVGSEDDDEVYISKNSDYADFAFSSPRVSGEGGLLTLDGPSRGFGAIGSSLIAFAGPSSIFTAQYEQITVGSTLAETLKVKKVDTGVNQGALNPDCIIPIGNALAYLSNEVALRIIQNPNDINGLDPRTFSNPIKPDFDAEDWDNAKGIWHKNAIWLTAPTNSHLYILQFREDADGKVRRFWQPPQILPIDPLSIISGILYGHSNTTAETYYLFNPDRLSDIVGNGDNDNPDDKTPINAIAVFALRNEGKRANLKTFDEYFVEGEINEATNDLLLTIDYDYAGDIQTIEKTIDGTDEDILGGNVQYNSLAQASLGTQPIGGLLNPPEDARRFKVIFEIAREDYHELGATFSSNSVDRFWTVISHGANSTLSPRRDTIIRK